MCYPYRLSDLIDETGVVAQGNSNPPSRFEIHYMAKRNGRYYDVSYGNDYGTLLEWQQGAVAGYWGVAFDGSVTNAGLRNSSYLEVDE